VAKNYERYFLWTLRAKILGDSIRAIATSEGVKRHSTVQSGIEATMDRLPDPQLANEWFRPYVEALARAR
jgi:hypothetical protein